MREKELRERAELVAIRGRVEQALQETTLARQHAEIFADTEHPMNDALLNLVCAQEHLKRAREALAGKPAGGTR